MTRLFRRRYALTVDEVRITDLDVAFRVERTLSGRPNKAEIQVWNLSPDRRAQLEALDRVAVRLDAGYEDDVSTLFLGYLRRATSERDGADIVTTFSGIDRVRSRRRARRSFGAGTLVRDVARSMADEVEQAGVERGLVDRAFETVTDRLPEGLVATRPPEVELSRLARRVGREISVQNGRLQALELGRALQGTAVRLAPETGLVGAPEVDSKGKVTVRMLLIPDVIPGRRLQVESEKIKGIFRVRAARYIGQTAGRDWYIEAEVEDEQKAAARARRARRRSQP